LPGSGFDLAHRQVQVSKTVPTIRLPPREQELEARIAALDGLQRELRIERRRLDQADAAHAGRGAGDLVAVALVVGDEAGARRRPEHQRRSDAGW
jgi:hypothetical protein